MDHWGEARAVATADVRRTLDWLVDSGFEVVETLGRPRSQGFSVRLVGSGPAVRVSRDKGQWWCDIMNEQGEEQPLDVFVMAMGATLPDHDEGRATVPAQLPVGVSWSEELPRIFDWLATADRAAALDQAGKAWREENMRRWRKGPS